MIDLFYQIIRFVSVDALSRIYVLIRRENETGSSNSSLYLIPTLNCMYQVASPWT